MLVLKIILILVLLTIFYQDTKERLVYWFLFPIIGLCNGIIFYYNTLPELFLSSILINILFISLLLLIIYLYAKFKLKSSFYKVFGIGDVCFFLASAFAFSSISFLVIFTSALIFSYLLHLVAQKKRQSVPLAGYMSLFFCVSYMGYWVGAINSVYQI